MPELCNIQTYQNIHQSTIESLRLKIGNVLKRICVWNDEVINAVEAFEWKPDADGCVFTSLTGLNFYPTKCTSFKVRPHIMIYKKGLDETFKDDWVSVEFLILATDVFSQGSNEIKESVQGELSCLMFELHQEFQESGIYFTDEAQDGNDFNGIRTNNSSLLWNFYAALIPNTLKKKYVNVPSNFQIFAGDEVIKAWNETLPKFWLITK